MNEQLKKKIDALDVSTISVERKERLIQVVSAMQSKIDKGELVNLVFVCTHNSRRSQFSQIWAHILADYFKIDTVNSYSAGTEATALYPAVLDALREDVSVEHSVGDRTNPYYLLKFGENSPLLVCFSKTLENPLNPRTEFIAIMTCSEADNGCPMVIGASHRISLPFEDPKKSDGTSEQSASYSATSELIATELKFVFSSIQRKS